MFVKHMCGCYIYDFDCTFVTYVLSVLLFIITCSKVSIKSAHNDQLSLTPNELRDLSHVSNHQQCIPWVKSFQMIPMLTMVHATCNNAVYRVWVIPRQIAQELPRPPSILMKFGKLLAPIKTNTSSKF